MIAQHVTQGPVNDVRRRVSARGRLPTRGVDLAVHLLALADLAGPDDTGVNDDVARPELRVRHRDRPAGRPDDSLVADLTAGLRVERRPVQDEADLLALARDPRPPAGPDQREHRSVGLEGLVPD